MNKNNKNFIKEIMIGATLALVTTTVMIAFKCSPDNAKIQHIQSVNQPIEITIPEVTQQKTLQGKVVRVKDGDTIVILTEDMEQVTIRLKSIDCPEKNQPFGKKAKEFVISEVAGKQVEITDTSLDRYKRTIGFVLYDSKNLSKQLLKNGLAWHYVKYSTDQDLQNLEDEARIKKTGLWSDNSSIAPWKFRKLNKN